MSYLKYYFKYDDDKLQFDAMPCIEGESPTVPKNFVKWYEPGDLAMVLTSACQGDSPVFNAIFAPNKFSAESLYGSYFGQQSQDRKLWEKSNVKST